MKNFMLIILILTINSSCQKSDAKDEPSGVFIGKLMVKRNIIKSNNEITDFPIEGDIEIDFDKKIMKARYCENNIQVIDNMNIVIGKTVGTSCPDNMDCICPFVNDSIAYNINNDILSISFKTLKYEKQYNNETETTTIWRTGELKRK